MVSLQFFTNRGVEMAIAREDLIGGFYEAAFEPARFPEALRQLGAFGGGIGAVMLLWDERLGEPALLASSGHMGPDAPEAYRERYAQLDPYRPVIDTMPTGAWTSCAAFFDDRFVARDAFYNEYLLPRGTRYMTAARVLSGDAFAAYVGLHRGPRQAPFTHDEVARLEGVGRQLARAARLHVDLTHGRLGRETASGRLEALAKPALLIDARCRVLYANPPAEAMLRGRTELAVERGCLTVRARDDTDRFQRHVHAAIEAGSGADMVLTPPTGAPTTRLTIAPAGPITTVYSLAPIGAALVLVHPLAGATPSSARLQSLFRLTRAEVALAERLARGQRLAEIAAAREVSIETVRTQLRALFRKTGTSRQPDLIRVLLGSGDEP
jgi:DNA-binding CsgD family transcriptional regulator